MLQKTSLHTRRSRPLARCLACIQPKEAEKSRGFLEIGFTSHNSRARSLDHPFFRIPVFPLATSLFRCMMLRPSLTFSAFAASAPAHVILFITSLLLSSSSSSTFVFFFFLLLLLCFLLPPVFSCPALGSSSPSFPLLLLLLGGPSGVGGQGDQGAGVPAGGQAVRGRWSHAAEAEAAAQAEQGEVGRRL